MGLLRLFLIKTSPSNMRIFTSAEDDPGKKRQVSNPTPATAAESSNPRTSEPHTSLPKLPGKKKSDERPSKEVPEERTAAQIRPTSQGARSKQRNSIVTESAHESTVSQGGYSSVLFNHVNILSFGFLNINFTVRRLQQGTLIPLFCSRPNFLDLLARKRLLRLPMSVLCFLLWNKALLK